MCSCEDSLSLSQNEYNPLFHRQYHDCMASQGSTDPARLNTSMRNYVMCTGKPDFVKTSILLGEQVSLPQFSNSHRIPDPLVKTFDMDQTMFVRLAKAAWGFEAPQKGYSTKQRYSTLFRPLITIATYSCSFTSAPPATASGLPKNESIRL